MIYTKTAFYDFALAGYKLQDLNELWAIGIIKDEMTYDEYVSVECYLETGMFF